SALGATGVPMPATWIERSTIFGESHLKELTYASEALFTAKVTVERRQQGCVRFSFVPPGSSTPRTFRCQPELEVGDQSAAAKVASISTPIGTRWSVGMRGASARRRPIRLVARRYRSRPRTDSS